MAAPQLVEFVAKSLVDHPDQVEVVVTQEAGTTDRKSTRLNSSH